MSRIKKNMPNKSQTILGICTHCLALAGGWRFALTWFGVGLDSNCLPANSTLQSPAELGPHDGPSAGSPVVSLSRLIVYVSHAAAVWRGGGSQSLPTWNEEGVKEKCQYFSMKLGPAARLSNFQEHARSFRWVDMGYGAQPLFKKPCPCKVHLPSQDPFLLIIILIHPSLASIYLL